MGGLFAPPPNVYANKEKESKNCKCTEKGGEVKCKMVWFKRDVRNRKRVGEGCGAIDEESR